MSEIEPLLLQVFIQLAVIIAAARVGAWLLGLVGQPQVVGEIVAGLVLGPSLLGRFAPEVMDALFPADATIIFRVLSELGLVLLMFLIGLEFEFSHLRQVGRAAVGVATAGIAIPFVMGIALAWRMHPQVAEDLNRPGFALIVAVALSITAIPILGRIMIELNIHRTALGTLTITAAAIDDAIGWILLATVSTMIHGDFELWAIARMSLLTVLFVGGCWFLGRPLLARCANYLLRQDNGDLTLVGFSAVLVTVFMSAAATNAIGIFSIFGPFVLGAALSGQHEFRDATTRRLREIVYALFLPIFFTYSGLHTNVGLLESWRDWSMCCLILAVAMIGKMGGCGLAARVGGLPWRESGCVAIMMNTRALMGLIAINVGRELGVVPDNVFCMLVIMALVTTFVTTPLLHRFLRDPIAQLAYESASG
ncbi:MAG: cation:proton antiporter [Planctomycetales bacterium]|nr:cation:proton antiporter [Planctomycetales bacterium]